MTQATGMVFTVYVATFERLDSPGLFRYAGMPSLSLNGRGANHVEMPVDWGRGMKRANASNRVQRMPQHFARDNHEQLTTTSEE